MDDRSQDAGFLSRWSRRKALVRGGQGPADPVDPGEAAAGAAALAKARGEPPAPAPTATAAALQPAGGGAAGPTTAPSADACRPSAPEAVVAPPPPTLADVATLGRDSDYSRFVAADVDGGVRNAALHKLFSDPRFNVMDGLDTYIDDYSIADPLPAGMLRKMVQSEALGLFAAEPDPTAQASLSPTIAAAQTAPATTESQAPDEDADLRLQPHDAAGHSGVEPGAGEDPASQH